MLIFCVSIIKNYQICFIISYNVIIIGFRPDLRTFEIGGAVKKFGLITILLPQGGEKIKEYITYTM